MSYLLNVDFDAFNNAFDKTNPDGYFEYATSGNTKDLLERYCSAMKIGLVSEQHKEEATFIFGAIDLYNLINAIVKKDPVVGMDFIYDVLKSMKNYLM